MKLSKAQQQVMQDAMQKIDRARACETFEEYFTKSSEHTPQWLVEMDSYKEKTLKQWQDEKNGIVSTYKVNTKTLRKLEELDLIKIIYDSTGDALGSDTIKVLNY